MNTEKESIVFFEVFKVLRAVGPIPGKDGSDPNRIPPFILLIFHFALLVALYIIQWVFKDRLYAYDTTMIFVIFDLAQVYCPFAVYTAVLFASIVHNQTDIEIRQTLRQIDCYLLQLYTEQDNRRFFSRFTKIFIVLAIVAPLPMIVIICSTFREFLGWAIGWSLRFWPCISTNAFIAYYAFHLLYICDKLDKMKIDLSDVLVCSSQKSKFREKVVRERLMVLRKAHRSIWKLLLKLDSRSYFLLASFLVNSLICANSSLYWWGMRIYTNYYDFFFESTLNALPFLIPMGVVVYVCENIKNKNESMAHVLHRISSRNQDTRTLSVIGTFSIEILQVERELGASFVSLCNYTIVVKLFYGLSKYFFIIFMVKADLLPSHFSRI